MYPLLVAAATVSILLVLTLMEVSEMYIICFEVSFYLELTR